MLRVALIGYGKMGKMIDHLAKDRGVEVVARISPSLKTSLSEESLKNADVCIDFSSPDVVLANIKTMAALGKTMVIGTTGWDSHLDEVKALVDKAPIALFHSTNFSIGVQLFFQLVTEAAKRLLPAYDVAVVEEHHKAKKDSPSGTALSILQKISLAGKDAPSSVASSRVGSVVGTHSLLFDSFQDQITLSHIAKNREGFAIGSLEAAKWVYGKRGVFTMEDMLR